MEFPNDSDTLFWMLVTFILGALFHWVWMQIRNAIDDRRAKRLEEARAQAELERQRLLTEVRRIVNGEELAREDADEDYDDGTDNSLDYQPGR